MGRKRLLRVYITPELGKLSRRFIAGKTRQGQLVRR